MFTEKKQQQTRMRPFFRNLKFHAYAIVESERKAEKARETERHTERKNN